MLVENVTLSDVTVGLRIKTYQGGTGAVHDVVFRDVVMQNVGAALVINQVRKQGATKQGDSVGCGKNASVFFTLDWSGIPGGSVWECLNVHGEHRDVAMHIVEVASVITVLRLLQYVNTETSIPTYSVSIICLLGMLPLR